MEKLNYVWAQVEELLKKAIFDCQTPGYHIGEVFEEAFQFMLHNEFLLAWQQIHYIAKESGKVVIGPMFWEHMATAAIMMGKADHEQI